MTSSFRLVGLAPDVFEPLFDLPAPALAARGMRRVVADAEPGFPCRVSLADARVGDELLLLPYEHLPDQSSPYHGGGAIYVRRGARPARLGPGELPPYVTRRTISVRAYDAAQTMIAGEVHPGTALREPIERLLANADVAWLHLHNAGRGCFACRVERA